MSGNFLAAGLAEAPSTVALISAARPDQDRLVALPIPWPYAAMVLLPVEWDMPASIAMSSRLVHHARVGQAVQNEQDSLQECGDQRCWASVGAPSSLRAVSSSSVATSSTTHGAAGCASAQHDALAKYQGMHSTAPMLTVKPCQSTFSGI